jgi:hypothetical protein
VPIGRRPKMRRSIHHSGLRRTPSWLVGFTRSSASCFGASYLEDTLPTPSAPPRSFAPYHSSCSRGDFRRPLASAFARLHLVFSPTLFASPEAATLALLVLHSLSIYSNHKVRTWYQTVKLCGERPPSAAQHFPHRIAPDFTFNKQTVFPILVHCKLRFSFVLPPTSCQSLL